MFSKRTFKTLSLIIIIYSLLWIPRLFIEDKSVYFETPFGVIADLPMLIGSLNIGKINIPSLTTGGGGFSCILGCPSTLGWIVIFISWFIIVWLFSWFISSSINSIKQSRKY